MSQFAFADDGPPARRSPPPGPSWLHTFSAVFAGALLAGVVLLVGVRFYVYWSIQDSLDKLKNPPAAKGR